MLISSTSERLKEVMREQGLRQVDLLEKIEPYASRYGVAIKKNQLSQYLSGKVMPRQDKLDVIAECLGVNPAWLMGSKGAPKYIRPVEDVPIPSNAIPFESKTHLSLSSNRVAAGAGISQADSEAEIYETEFPPDTHFAIRASGDAMYPKIEDGDILILKCVSAVEDGEIAAVYIGKDPSPIVREIHTDEEDNLILISMNSKIAKPKIYTAEQRDSLPVRICGKLVEIRRPL